MQSFCLPLSSQLTALEQVQELQCGGATGLSFLYIFWQTKLAITVRGAVLF